MEGSLKMPDRRLVDVLTKLVALLPELLPEARRFVLTSVGPTIVKIDSLAFKPLSREQLAKVDQVTGYFALVPVSEPECSCPSGDGSLRHPCAAHPAPDVAARDAERFRWMTEDQEDPDAHAEFAELCLRLPVMSRAAVRAFIDARLDAKPEAQR